MSWWHNELKEPSLHTLVAETVREKRVANEELLSCLRRRERRELGLEIHTLNQVVKMISHEN